MRASDVVVLVLALAAVAGTAVGVAKSDDWTGERTYAFVAGTSPLPPQGDVAAGTAPARFEVPAPTNATGLRAEVQVTFTGQPVQGGNAVVRIAGTAPDGTPLPVVTRTMAIAQAQPSAELAIPYNATWLEMPSSVRDTQAPEGRTWDRPLVLLVSVERPSDVPVAGYAFTATVTGSLTTYASG